jgi:hypothetical protein
MSSAPTPDVCRARKKSIGEYRGVSLSLAAGTTAPRYCQRMSALIQLIVVFVLAFVSVIIGIVVIRNRRRIASKNENAIRSSFPGRLAERSAESSTPGIFSMVGIGAIVVGAIVLVVAILTTFGVLRIVS